MQNIDLTSERAARLILERRRDREAERRERVFNDKVRTVGVDREALDEQVQERKRQEEKVKQEQAAFDADAIHQSRAAGVLQIRRMKQKHELEEALHAFRSQNQQAWTRTEFDLNDPDRWRKMDPSDAQMILPGLVGEDPTKSSRHQRQKEQLREWLVQQQAEQETSRGQRELEDQKYNQSREEILNTAGERLHLQKEQRKEAAIATKNYNLAMIEEKHQLKEQNDPDYVLESAAVPGFSPSADRLELERKQEDERFDRVRLDSARAALLMERRQARISKQLRRQLDSTNVHLAQTHKQQKPDIERGQIDESFFSKFNTCSR
ncbi:RIB43A-like with coiled-coils protein 2 isoform X2 [Oryzias melastigma]|uniref:RIB43A-like with coiled-coils protein 2 isoform X2 n=1 Tax=Oryzias melastigma TaxID=30732 RepID=UPI000CF7E890|nr:RIB43A-like with coiled-coils protein 2 isoform X2 [Oryzias melastigma]